MRNANIELLEKYDDGYLRIHDYSLGKYSAECNKVDCIKVVKTYPCGCTITWTSHVHGNRYEQRSRKKDSCNRGICVLNSK